MNVVKKTFQYGKQNVTLETGRIARQATSAVMVTVDDTVVLVTVVGAKKAKEGIDFFPLTVNYQEKTYAVGKIPGGFFKREGRPTEKETLTSRLIDRPIRPLFANGFSNEVQVIATVLSASKENDSDIAALLGTSAALAISGLPFNGPIGAARVGFNYDQGYLLNPSYEETEKSALDMVVAATQQAVIMVESEAAELTEDQMLGAVLFGHQEMQVAISAINEFANDVNKPNVEWQPIAENTALSDQIKSNFLDEIKSAYQITDKMQRYDTLNQLRAQATEQLTNEESDDYSEKKITEAFNKIEKQQVREQILSGQPRIDGRDTKTVRPISIETGILPKTHGSALFTRGETQAIVVATLGSLQDAQIIDDLSGERKDRLMLHYNFPPFCVGETGFLSGPKRREIGHGRLARRGIQATIPTDEEFPYTIRLVSEITESNGSSSMASVCGSSLALMDAGVPIKAPVAGVAMGLVKENERFAVLTDILGDEDHLGDMDFKVTGTSDGVTALQMDIKIEGINEEIMEIALNQAQSARLHILGEMNKVMSQPRSELSENAPQTLTIKIHPDKIRDVIGKGGATIRSLCEETNASIDIDDNGLIRIYAEGKDASKLALKRIEELTTDIEVGKLYKGKVARIVDFGAFVNLAPGKDGLLHISQISNERVENVSDYLQVDQEVNVVVLDIDNRGRVKLSMKEIAKAEAATEATSTEE